MTIDLPMIEIFGRGGALKSTWYGDCLPSRDFPMLDRPLPARAASTSTPSSARRSALDDVEEAFDKMHRGDVLRSVVVLEIARDGRHGMPVRTSP